MKTITGRVISIKMNRTVVVAVDRQVAHPKYNKRVKRTTKYHARANQPVAVGDIVSIHQVKPFSKTVHWQVEEVG